MTDWDTVLRRIRERHEEMGPATGIPFTLEVDEIVSMAWAYDDHVRPMFEITTDDNGVPSAWARQRWDNPPSEDELDAWVRGTADVL